MIETTHVRIRLVSPDKEIFNSDTGTTISGKDILKQMKINNVWHNDREGKYAMVQHSGQTFKFREGDVLTVPASIAQRLRQNSAICVGSDKLNGPIVPFLEITDSFEMSEPKAQVKAQFACPICGEDQKNPAALARHLGQERKKNPDIFKEEKTNWDAPTATDGEDAE